jgi:hypothetical protein
MWVSHDFKEINNTFMALCLYVNKNNKNIFRKTSFYRNMLFLPKYNTKEFYNILLTIFYIFYFHKKMNREKKLKNMKLKNIKLIELSLNDIENKKAMFQFPDEIWDIILVFSGYQKILNYDELLKIDINILIRSYLDISVNFDNFYFFKNGIKKKIIIKKQSKHIDYYNKKKLLIIYIFNNFNKLLFNTNLLKKALIYFHIKVYITFLSNYCSFKPLHIDLQFIFNKAILFDLFKKQIKQIE